MDACGCFSHHLLISLSHPAGLGPLIGGEDRADLSCHNSVRCCTLSTDAASYRCCSSVDDRQIRRDPDGGQSSATWLCTLRPGPRCAGNRNLLDHNGGSKQRWRNVTYSRCGYRTWSPELAGSAEKSVPEEGSNQVVWLSRNESGRGAFRGAPVEALGGGVVGAGGLCWSHPAALGP